MADKAGPMYVSRQVWGTSLVVSFDPYVRKQPQGSCHVTAQNVANSPHSPASWWGGSTFDVLRMFGGVAAVCKLGRNQLLMYPDRRL